MFAAACNSVAGGGGGGDDDPTDDARGSGSGSNGGGATNVFASTTTKVVVEIDYSSAGDKGYKGIGAALVRAREEFLVVRGETEAQADIRATNAPSLRMFANLGYAFNEASRVALEKWQAAPDKESVPVLVLTKKLDGPGGPG